MKRSRGQALAVALLVTLAALLAGCGSKSAGEQTSTSTTASKPTDGIPRLDFAYDKSAPLDYVDRGRVNPASRAIAVHDVSFRSGGRQVQGYLLLPPGSKPRPAVVFVTGAGGNRSDLISEAAWLAARNVVTLVITPPSTSIKSTATTGDALLAQAKALTVNDVIAVRRAVDVLQTLPSVDKRKIGYVGWSLGAKTGAFVAAAEPRITSLALLSAGADPLAAFVASAPPSLRAKARRVLGSVDPIRYIAWARPGSVLLEDSRNDEVVPQKALLNIAHAAPKGTELRWYQTAHALDPVAYEDAFDWLAKKLPITGGNVSGAPTGP